MTDTPVVVTTSKPWYQSRTMWLNIISTAVGAYSMFEPLLTPQQKAIALAVNGVLNIILRFLTDQSVTVTKQGS